MAYPSFFDAPSVPSKANEDALLRLHRRLQTPPRRLAWLKVCFLFWRIANAMDTALKRTLDVLVSSTALLVMMPMLLVVAALIKLTDGGQVLFWQSRLFYRYVVGNWIFLARIAITRMRER